MTHGIPKRGLAVASFSVLVALAALGCGSHEQETPASAPLEAPTSPTAASSVSVTLDASTSALDFVMTAPVEHIHGRAPESLEGTLSLDLHDLTQSRGLVKSDLLKLAVLQSKIDEETHEFTEETRNERQNEHMRTWFQISDDAPAEQREANRWVEFRIDEVRDVDHADVTAMTGDERRVHLTVAGQLRVHGVTVPKTAELALVFHYSGDTFQSVDVRTVGPIDVNLAEHHIEPRSSFETLAQKTLGALGQKVADAAPVTFSVTARPAR